MRSAGTSESKKKTVRSWVQGMNRQRWAVVLLAGLLLMVIALPVSQKTGTARQSTLLKDNTQSTVEIQSTLELKLQDILESMEGAGKVKVMLMTGEQQGIYQSEEAEVKGVLIAAEGAADPVVVQKIQQAVMALFQIEAHKIKIIKMK